MTGAVVPNLPEEPAVLDEQELASLGDVLMKTALNEEKTGRRAEVRRVWKARAFREGIQQLFYDSGSYAYLTPEASGKDLPKYRDVYNIYTPHWRSFVSILSQNATGINFVPKSLKKTVDIDAARYAEKMRAEVDRLVQMLDRQAEAAGYFCTDGRTITWSRIDENGHLRISMHGVLESKVPLYVRGFENWDYLVLSEEVGLLQAQDENPDFANEIEADTGSENTYERLARMNVIANRRGGVADSLKTVTTRHVGWFKPARYKKAPDALRAKLRALYPDGLRMTQDGGAVVECIPARMEQALRVDWPSPGQGSSRPGLLDDILPIQEAYNDYKNHLRESADYIDDAQYVHGGAVDTEAITEQRAAPDELHVITPPNGLNITDCLGIAPGAKMSPELTQACEQLKQDAEFISGDLPSVYGGDTEGQDTVGVNKLLTAQAKGQLTMAWSGLKRLFAGTYEIAVKLAAQMYADQAEDPFNAAAILGGEFGAYPDADSSYPETMADKRAALQTVLTQLGPADPKLVLHPDNLKLIQQYSGLKDLVIPGAEARDKQLREIEQLLRETPVPDPAKEQEWEQQAIAAMSAGQEPPPQPMMASVGIGKRDFHQAELDKCAEWLSSPACFEEQQKGNQKGVDNVSLHADLHEAAIQAAAAANAPQQTRMSISGAFKDLDPATKVQVLQADGYQPDASAYETDAVQGQQSTAADTQLTAAEAQHKAVLAAKEAASPSRIPGVPGQGE